MFTVRAHLSGPAPMVRPCAIDDPLHIQGELEWNHVALPSACPQETEKMLQLWEIRVWTVREMFPA